MRFYFLKMLVILVMAVGAAVWIQKTPGLIVIELGEYTLAGSLWLALFLLLFVWFLWFLLRRLLRAIYHFPGGIKLFFFGSKASRIDREMRDLLMASMIDDTGSERKHLEALAKLQFYPGLCLLKSAWIALLSADQEAYLDHVKRAKKDASLPSWMADFMELRVALLKADDHTKITTLMDRLKKEPAAEKAVWTLALRYAKSMNDWKLVREAIDRLKSLKQIDASQVKSMKLECDAAELSSARHLSELETLWKSFPRNRRKEPVLLSIMDKKRAQFVGLAHKMAVSSFVTKTGWMGWLKSLFH